MGFLPKSAPEPLEPVALPESKECRKCRKRLDVSEFSYSTNRFGRIVFAPSCKSCGGPTPKGYSQPVPKVKAPRFKAGFETPLGLLLMDLMKLASDMGRCEGAAIAAKAKKDPATARMRWFGYYQCKHKADRLMEKIINAVEWKKEGNDESST